MQRRTLERVNETIADAFMEHADAIEALLHDEDHEYDMNTVHFMLDHLRTEAFQYDPQSWNRYPEKEYN